MSLLGQLTPTPPAPAPRRRWPLVLGIVSGLMILAVILVLSPWDRSRGQWLQDQWTVLTQPSPDEIVAIADATGMSDDGRLIFLASTPAIEDAEQFNDDCAVESEGTLGCFDGTDIYIYAVTDPRLQGTIEVTGAHEMLHAAYQRLSPDERTRVDALVADAVAALPPDDPVFQDMKLYPESQWPDEWHSRLGTEFADLPAALEAHYDRYFDDRSLVLALDEKSTALLDQLEAQLDELAARVAALDAEVGERSTAYDAALASYTADVAAFNERADSGGFGSQQEFDEARAALVARQRALEQERTALNAQIDEYNALVDQLTALDADYADLYQGLDSTAPPAGAPQS
jgi:cell division protein FtsB